MKSRKEIIHNLLVQEVIEQTQNRFIPNISLIKKTLEHLIDKGYLERASDSNDRYLYVA